MRVDHLVHELTDKPTKEIAIDGNAITEIILAHGAPPDTAPVLANAIIDYLVEVHRLAGATRVQ